MDFRKGIDLYSDLATGNMTLAGRVLESWRPMIVCLCGSTRFKDQFAEKNLEFTLEGKIVLTIGCDTKSDDEIWPNMSLNERLKIKAKLDALHMCKIDMSDKIYVINVGGYVGESTNREIEYARLKGKSVVFMET